MDIGCRERIHNVFAHLERAHSDRRPKPRDDVGRLDAHRSDGVLQNAARKAPPPRVRDRDDVAIALRQQDRQAVGD